MLPTHKLPWLTTINLIAFQIGEPARLITSQFVVICGQKSAVNLACACRYLEVASRPQRVMGYTRLIEDPPGVIRLWQLPAGRVRPLSRTSGVVRTTLSFSITSPVISASPPLVDIYPLSSSWRLILASQRASTMCGRDGVEVL